MDDENKGKNYYSQQELSLEEKSFKIKTFNLFYEISKVKIYNVWTISIFIVFEMLQLISYAFDDPHKPLWKLPDAYINNISIILGVTRIVALMKFVNFTIYIVIFIFLIILIFILFLFILMEILFGEIQTKLYEKCVYITNIIINPLCILLYIPITELILLSLKCKDGNVDIIRNGIKCYENLHYLYFFLGIIGSILLFVCCFYLLNFYFFPFHNYSNTLRLTSKNDILLLVSKFIVIYRYILIKSDYLSIVILLGLNLFLLNKEFNNSTYNNKILNLICNIRNIAVFWTYFVLLISKILEQTHIDGIIFLLLFGYPVIIFSFIIFINKKELSYDKINDKYDNVEDFLLKTKYKIHLIDSFLDNNKNAINNNNTEIQKNEILLKGTIQKHNEKCINEECPLIKFQNNPGNYYIQKQCLLNYMNNYFEDGLKRFPQNINLLIYFVQFNYNKRYNLNSVRENLTKLKNMEKNIGEDFIIFCIEQNIKKMKNKISENNDTNEQELEKDLLEQKLQRLKFLIENSTKLYGEFWGIFATNITNNLNTLKLYILGEKINKYLNEMNTIWDNNIKSNRLEISHHGIIQLYSHFLKEILWNKKKSDEITKKLNEEQHHHEAKKIDEENFHGNNFEAILENQDYVFYCSSNDKGKCTIIQCSNSIINLLGYEKSEIIGKAFEYLIPSILIEGHMRTIEEYIKNLNVTQKPQQEFNKGTDNNEILLLPKNKMGYILPFICKFTIYDDNDFSNSYIIKAKLEPKENKSLYTYYILTKRDFTVSCISSSAIYLGLTLDLLKKYMIKLDILIRKIDDRKLKIDENFNTLEEQEMEIKWVYPDIIYPKNNIKKIEIENIDDLVKLSKKTNCKLKINIFRNGRNETTGICFRLMDVKTNSLLNIQYEDYIPKTKNEFIFDIITLHYIRAKIVEEKTGNKNLFDFEDTESDKLNLKLSGPMRVKSDRRDNSPQNKDLIEEEDDYEDRKKEYILTKEKINEIQGEDHIYINNFINNLPFYGRDVQLERHRPNKERYPVGKIQEPNIKIIIANFCKDIDKKKNILKKLNFGGGGGLNEEIESPKKNITDNLTREFNTDTSTSLSNIFNAKSISYIKLLSFLIIVLIIALIILEFVFTYFQLNDIKARIEYLEYGYQLLSNMIYIKYFVSETVFAFEIPEKFGDNNDISYYYNKDERTKFIEEIKLELGEYLVLFNRLLNNFNSPTITLSGKYTSFTSKVNMSIYTITISENTERESIIYEGFSSAMRRIPSDVFFLSSNTNQDFIYDMKNQNCFQLMENILNTFYTTWKEATGILFNDVKYHCTKSSISYILLVSSFIVTIISLIAIYKLLIIFSTDREKPINLFLTIKKNLFEELKNASESFSNKLLNKFFGNEENEEEAQEDYTNNIKENDINIIKFKAINEHKLTGNKDKTNIIIFIYLLFFLVFFNIYIVFKFWYSYDNIKNISRFTDVFNTTQTVHTNIILTIDVIKSFLFNESIPIFNKTGEENTLKEFLYAFYNKSNTFEETILSTSISNSFLDNSYRDKFYEYLYHDYDKLVKNNISEALIEKKNKFNPILNKLFEDLKYISLKYLNYGYKENREEFKKNNKEKAEFGYPSKLITDKIWMEINELTTIYIRYWFKNILDLMMENLNNYVNKMRLIHITIFIILAIIIIFAYCIVWKNYENKLIVMLKRSVNLINLIPEEIKYMIVTKLNE